MICIIKLSIQMRVDASEGAYPFTLVTLSANMMRIIKFALFHQIKLNLVQTRISLRNSPIKSAYFRIRRVSP